MVPILTSSQFPFHFIHPLHLPLSPSPISLTLVSPACSLEPPLLSSRSPTCSLLHGARAAAPPPPSFPLPPPHPLLLSDALPQEDAGGAHGELHGGAGRSSPGTNLKTAPLLRVPLGGSASLSSLSLLCLSWPLPGRRGPRAVAAGAESYSGWGGDQSVSLPPHLARVRRRHSWSQALTFYPQNGIRV